jgi:tyrosyl-tRNA synthetase
MALSDETVIPVFKLCTETPLSQVQEFEKMVREDPMGIKKKLAFEITKMYHGDKSATKALNEFETVFSKGGVPTDISVWKVADKKINLPELLTEKGVVESKSEVRRLISQGAVSLNGKKLSVEEPTLGKGILKIGKRFFVKIA